MNEIVIQGIPYDEKSSYLKGTAKAPALIRETYRSFAGNYFSEDGTDTDSRLVIDKGDFGISTYFDIESVSRENLKNGARLITLGGDHSITYPVLRAFNDIHPRIDILHFDAHPDLYDELLGDKHSHACPFARIMENGLAARLVQVGIRTLNKHQKEQAGRFDVEIQDMRDFDVSNIPEFENPVYLSIDMDAFDPAFAPGVSHQEPGGLTSREVISIIQKINQRIIGADIVELNPLRDVQNITAALAAKLLKEVIAQMLQK